MIRLIVEEYCQNCPEFEPDVNKDKQEMVDIDLVSFMGREKRKVFCNTTVACQHRDRCAVIYECATNKVRE